MKVRHSESSRPSGGSLLVLYQEVLHFTISCEDMRVQKIGKTDEPSGHFS